MSKKYYCSVSNNLIPEQRVEALKVLGVPEDQWTCVEFSNTSRKKGIYFGNHGSGQLVIASYVDNRGLVDEAEAISKLEE